MRVSGQTAAAFALIFCGGLAAVPTQAAPLGRPGTVAYYELAEPAAARPAFETRHGLSVVEACIRLGPVVRARRKKASRSRGRKAPGR